jgi:hypothetical protein
MRIGSVWRPILLCLVMMALCGGPLLRRWQRAHRRPQHAQPTVTAWLAVWADAGHKERLDG